MRLSFLAFIIFSVIIHLPAQNSSIQINMPNNLEDGVITAYSNSQNKILASVNTNKAKQATLKFDLLQADFLSVQINQKQLTYTLLHPGESLVFYINPETDSMSVSGSQDAMQYLELLQKNKAIMQSKRGSIYDKYRLQEEMTINFMKENPNKLAQLSFVTSIDLAENLDLCKKNLAALQKKYPENYWVKNFQLRLLSDSLTAIGATVPELMLPDTTGNILKLQDLRGKVVLLDFWASWCKPCRQQNPDLIKLYTQFHSQGLEIVSISLDKNKERWLRAIKKDQIGKWYHVSDLMFWQSSAAIMFNINSIPTNILINKKGQIVARNLNKSVLKWRIKKLIK